MFSKDSLQNSVTRERTCFKQLELWPRVRFPLLNLACYQYEKSYYNRHYEISYTDEITVLYAQVAHV